MSYHIVSIDAPRCSLSCKDGQLTCKTDEGAPRTLPIEDIAAIIITSFSASIHSQLLLEAARHGVALILCESFKPASLVLPANRATDTLLTRAQVSLGTQTRQRLWSKTIDAKCLNQASLARHLDPDHPLLPALENTAKGRKQHKEAHCAKAFWRIYAEAALNQPSFTRDRNRGGANDLLNYGYAVLLSTVLQKCFALGIDPTFGIGHVARARSTPLAYDLMEPFRPCVDWRLAQWTAENPDSDSWQITREYRGWVTAFPLQRVEYLNLELDISGCIEGVIRSFRNALAENKTGPYKPWIQPNSRWAG